MVFVVANRRICKSVMSLYVFLQHKGICNLVSSLFVFASKRMALTNGRGRPSGARMPQEDHISSGSVGPGLQRTIPPLQWAILQNTTKYVRFFSIEDGLVRTRL